MKVKLIIGALVVLALAITVPIASSSLGLLSSTTPEPEQPIKSDPSPAARDQFAALSRSDLRAAARREVTAVQADSLGIDPENAVLARSIADTTIVLASGSGGLCTVINGPEGGSGGCVSEQDAATGRSFGVRGCSQTGLLIYGIAPDGVDQVRFTLRDGSTADSKVVNNVIAFTTPPNAATSKLPASVGWTGAASGEVKQPVPVPPDPRC